MREALRSMSVGGACQVPKEFPRIGASREFDGKRCMACRKPSLEDCREQNNPFIAHMKSNPYPSVKPFLRIGQFFKEFRANFIQL